MSGYLKIAAICLVTMALVHRVAPLKAVVAPSA